MTTCKNWGRGRRDLWVNDSSFTYDRTSRIHLTGILCATLGENWVDKNILENVAIANALQLEVAKRSAVPLRFNFVARAKFEVAQPIRCRLRTFLLLIRYVTL